MQVPEGRQLPRGGGGREERRTVPCQHEGPGADVQPHLQSGKRDGLTDSWFITDILEFPFQSHDSAESVLKYCESCIMYYRVFQESRRIRCVVLRCNLQCGITQPIL